VAITANLARQGIEGPVTLVTTPPPVRARESEAPSEQNDDTVAAPPPGDEPGPTANDTIEPEVLAGATDTLDDWAIDDDEAVGFGARPVRKRRPAVYLWAGVLALVVLLLLLAFGALGLVGWATLSSTDAGSEPPAPVEVAPDEGLAKGLPEPEPEPAPEPEPEPEPERATAEAPAPAPAPVQRKPRPAPSPKPAARARPPKATVKPAPAPEPSSPWGTTEEGDDEAGSVWGATDG